jgi:hypothetical protein
VIFFIYDNFRVLKVNLVAQICKRNEWNYKDRGCKLCWGSRALSVSGSYGV